MADAGNQLYASDDDTAKADSEDAIKLARAYRDAHQTIETMRQDDYNFMPANFGSEPLPALPNPIE